MDILKGSRYYAITGIEEAEMRALAEICGTFVCNAINSDGTRLTASLLGAEICRSVDLGDFTEPGGQD